MNYATNYDVGERKRTDGINEDSIAVTVFEQGHRDGVEQEGCDGWERTEQATPVNRSTAVVVLADGAGGHDAGDVASYIATTVICERLAPVAIRAARSDPTGFGVDVGKSLPQTPDATEIATELTDSIVAAHREILDYVHESGHGAYTTVVAGICVDGTFHYGWVGDSRAYVVNREQELLARLTKDHAVVEELHDSGEIDEIESYVHPRGNEITRALGGTGEEDPETATVSVETNAVELFAEDVLLLTSDGLIDAQTDASTLYDRYLESDRSEDIATEIRERVVTDDDICEWVLAADSIDDAATTLLQRANERGGKDNLSVVLVEDRALPPTPRESGLPVRAIESHEPIENRETVIVPDRSYTAGRDSSTTHR